jgi:UDP-N-acetylmuramyl pentapeptide phosphotransferase/UDP-N-acetylglucosamine-1-phosphate transferase
VVSLFQDPSTTAIPIPFLVLAVPIVDMSAVIIARVSTGCSPFTADCRHLHHRLLKAGLSHRFTVLVIYTLALWSGSLATVLMGITNSYVFLASATGLLGFMTWKILSSLRQTEPELEFSVR